MSEIPEHQPSDLDIDFSKECITRLPDKNSYPDVSSWSQTLEVDVSMPCGFLLRRNSTREIINSFQGATSYIQIPGKNDLLDIVLVRGNSLLPDAGAFFDGAYNHCMLQETTWENIATGADNKARNELERLRENDLLAAALLEDEVALGNHLKLRFSATLLHEIAHRMHYAMEMPQQLEMHSRFIQAADTEPQFRKAITRFMEILYSPHLSYHYLDAHTRLSKNPTRRYVDNYWRTLGLYDPRLITFSHHGDAINVPISSVITEALAYTSGRVLIDEMIRRGDQNGKHLHDLYNLVPEDEIDPLTVANRRMYEAIKASRTFNSESLSEVMPSSLVEKVLGSYRQFNNVADYLLLKTEDTEESDNGIQ